MKKRDKINLIVFIFVTLTIGILGYFLDQKLPEQERGNSLGMGLWLAGPLLTGIILRLFGRNFKDFGIKLPLKGKGKWYLVAFLTFPVIVLISLLLSKLTGTLTILPMDLQPLLALMIGSFVSSFIKNIFEEFSWRGCLLPFLEKTGMGDFLLYLASGLIWGMWHAVYYLFFLPDESILGGSRIGLFLSGIVIMTLWTPLFTELRRLTDSVWPCVLLHSMEDLCHATLFVTQPVFLLNGIGSTLFDPAVGIIPALLMLVLGLYLRKKRLQQ